MVSKKKKIDWEGIKREYRTGQVSITEIAAQFNCARETITRKAKKESWKRDLTKAVKKEVANKVTRITAVTDESQVTNENVTMTDEEVIEKAAERGKEIIITHRRDIANLRELEKSLINELKNNPTKLYITQYQGKIIEKVVGLTVAERALAANNLANVQHKRIQLERQAFNLNDTGDNEGEYILKIIKYASKEE